MNKVRFLLDEHVNRAIQRQLRREDGPRLVVEYTRSAPKVRAPTLATLPIPALLGPGEEESIRLAIELRADCLLVDDLDARRAAEKYFAMAGVSTAIQGTLGVIVSAYRAGSIPRENRLNWLRP
jgi:hypothetical protein